MSKQLFFDGILRFFFLSLEFLSIVLMSETPDIHSKAYFLLVLSHGMAIMAKVGKFMDEEGILQVRAPFCVQ